VLRFADFSWMSANEINSSYILPSVQPNRSQDWAKGCHLGVDQLEAYHGG
jgi:hypothetical protein